MTKNDLILVCMAVLLTVSLASCTADGLPVPGDVALPVSPQALVTGPMTAAQPPSTQVAPEQTAMSETTPQAQLSNSTTESVNLARADLARRLRVSMDSVIVNAVLGQDFSVDAFYCRAPKERIAKEDPPQLISGLSIVLSASARRYEYHARGPEVFFCRPLF